jgi:hypothetical protein
METPVRLSLPASLPRGSVMNLEEEASQVLDESEISTAATHRFQTKREAIVH